MRRLLAIGLTLLFGLTVAIPLVSMNAYSGLPQCCRRTGLHHCMGGGEAFADRTIASLSKKCPEFPSADIAPLPLILAPASAEDPGATLVARSNSAPQTEARYRVSYTRSRQKRGPPSLL